MIQMMEDDEIMDHEMSTAAEVARIIKRLEERQITPELARAQLHYMITTARTAEDLNVASTAYGQVHSIEI